MDNRLAFFSYVKEYAETLTDDDALLILSHNKKQGDCFTSLVGDWEILSVLFSQKGYINYEEGNTEQFENIKKMILNTAYNICMTDEEKRIKFIEGLEKE
jgi:hypothetical protein